jgi:hypothetical protein
MLCLCGHSGRSALTQLASRCFAGPGTRVDVAHEAQPFFGLGERRKITHVQAKPLAAFLESPADKKREAPELGQIRLRQGHGSRG